MGLGTYIIGIATLGLVKKNTIMYTYCAQMHQANRKKNPWPDSSTENIIKLYSVSVYFSRL